MFTKTPTIDASGALTYQRNPNTSGNFTLTVTLSDGAGGTVQHDLAAIATKPHKWHNTKNAFDVTGSFTPAPDGFVVAQDVVGIINYINARGSGLIKPATPAPPYIDVDADDQATGTDVVLIINWINAHPGQSEGEAANSSTQPAEWGSDSSMTDLISLIAADIASTATKRRRV